MKFRYYFVISVFCWLATVNVFSAGLDIEKTAQDIKSNVAMQQVYQIDKDITFTLTKSQSIKLTISDNPYEFAECYIHWGDIGDIGETVFMLLYDQDKNLLFRGGTRPYYDGLQCQESKSYLSGALRQVGDSPYLVITEWEKANEGLSFRFCVSSDKNKNTEVFNKAREGKKIFSIWHKNWKAFDPPQLTETEKIAGFVKLWSETKYNFAFFDRVPEVNWDQILIDYLPKVQNAKDVFEYYRVLKQSMALLKDGHTNVNGPSNEPSCVPPLKIRPIQGKVVITEIIPQEQLGSLENQEALKKANVKPGDEITHIDGRPIKEILEKDFYPYISASTPQWLDIKAFPDLLKGSFNSTVMLRIKKQNKVEQDISLVRKNYTFEHVPNQFEVKKLENNILYINLNGFDSEDIVKQFELVLPKIFEANGLILDVRKNGGGNSGDGVDIIRYLIDKPIEDTIWKTPKHIAAYKAWGRENEDWLYGDKEMIQSHSGKTFTGPIVVLTSAETFSAAEDFTVVLHAAKRALIVGERTGGSTGQPLHIDNLPGCGSARICTKWDTYPDGRDFIGVGVIPDIEIYPTPEDIAAGKDTILQEGIKQIKMLIEKKI